MPLPSCEGVASRVRIMCCGLKERERNSTVLPHPSLLENGKSVFPPARDNTCHQHLFCTTYIYCIGGFLFFKVHSCMETLPLDTRRRDEDRNKEKAKRLDKTKGETGRDLTLFFATIKASQINLALPLNRYSPWVKPRGCSTQTAQGRLNNYFHFERNFLVGGRWLTDCIHGVRGPATPRLTQVEIKEQQELNYTLAKTSGERLGREAWWMRKGSEQ